MAEENQNKQHLQTATESGGADIKDRGVFDFLGKKKDDVDHQENKQPHPHQPDQEEVIVTEFDKVTVSEEEPAAAAAAEKKKHSSILEKLHRSDSSSSSSSEEEGEDGEKKKKKKEKKKKNKEEEDNTSVPVEKIEIDNNVTEEKKGFLDKIKEKLPGGGHKKSTTDQDQDHVNVNVTTTTTTSSTTPPPAAADDKKGILEKIKEKLPGYHPKTTTTTTDEVVEHTNKDHN